MKKQVFSLTIAAVVLCVSFIFTEEVEAATYTSVKYEQRYDGKYFLTTQTLTKDKSPYFIAGGCMVGSLPSYATLTVEAGVIVKFDISRYCNGGGIMTNITINGTLVVNGTEDEPVIFTSIKDDVGGDSNSDGSASRPERGDWGAIRLSPSSGNSIKISNAVIRYGAGGNFSSQLSVGSGTQSTDIVLRNIDFNSSGCYGFGAAVPVVISNSKFYDNSCGAIYGDLFWNPQITAINNWWGDDSGPAVPSNPSGKGQKFVGNVNYDPWLGKIVNLPPLLNFPIGDTDGVEPNLDYLPEQPAFKVLYSDPNNDSPSFVNVVINSTTYAMAAASSTESGTMYVFTPTTGTLQKGSYSFHFEAGDGKLVSRLPNANQIDPVFAVRNIPVVLVPGIAGTELKYGDELLWLNLEKMLFDIGDQFLNKLEMNSDGSSINDLQTSDVIRVKEFLPRVTYKYFGGLVSDLINRGYFEEDDLFVFPYDWRLDIRINSYKLSERISEILAETGSKKINLVTHSMGGLLAKQYAINYGTSSINKLIFVGTPHLGSPDAFKTLLMGSDFGIPFLSQTEIKSLAQNMSSVYELLPSKKYFENSGGYFIRDGSKAGFVETNEYLLERNANESLIASAAEFHSGIMDDFNPDGIDVYNIIGCHSATLDRIIERKYYNGRRMVRDYELSMSGGDGTVPLKSAAAISIPNANRYYIIDSTHSKMPSEDGTRELIVSLITNTVGQSLPQKVATTSGKCYLNGKLISVHSPVDLSVYDGAGGHVGPGDYGSIDQNIPGAAYFDMEGDKYIFLPDGVETDLLKLNASDSGSFSFEMATIKNDEIESKVVFADIPIVSTSVATVDLSRSSDQLVMEFDQDGDGNYETLLPSAVLDQSKSEDLVKPVTVASLSGEEGLNGWYRSPVLVQLSASDDNSGILYTEYSSDGGEVWLKYEKSFIVDRETVNEILFRSIDKARNKEDVKMVEIRIDSEPPEMVVTFDPKINIFLLSGSDNVSSTTVERGREYIKIADEAGNTTTLHFNIKGSRGERIFILEGVQYNSDNFIRKKARFLVQIENKRSGEILKLVQDLQEIEKFKVVGQYERKQDMTRIKVAGKKEKKLKMNGLVLFKLLTNKGNLMYTF